MVRGEIVSRASRTCKDPNAMHAEQVYVIANQGMALARTVDLADRLIESTGHSRRTRGKAHEDTPQLLQKGDGRSDAQEGQTENKTDGKSQQDVAYGKQASM